MNQPLVANIHLGDAEGGTHVYGVTDKAGRSHKEFADEVAINEKLSPPSGTFNGLLIGGLKVDVEATIDNSLVVVSKNRWRSSRATVDTFYTQMEPGTTVNSSPTTPPKV
jgi:hypothetical protein